MSRKNKELEKDLQREGERLLRSMQTRKARAGLEKAFNASPAELGRAAVHHAKKKR